MNLSSPSTLTPAPPPSPSRFPGYTGPSSPHTITSTDRPPHCSLPRLPLLSATPSLWSQVPPSLLDSSRGLLGGPPCPLPCGRRDLVSCSTVMLYPPALLASNPKSRCRPRRLLREGVLLTPPGPPPTPAQAVFTPSQDLGTGRTLCLAGFPSTPRLYFTPQARLNQVPLGPLQTLQT